MRIQNFGGSAEDMRGWTLRDEVNRVFMFPSFTLGPGDTARVWTRAGPNDASNLYWESGSAIRSFSIRFLGEDLWTHSLLFSISQ